VTVFSWFLDVYVYSIKYIHFWLCVYNDKDDLNVLL